MDIVKGFPADHAEALAEVRRQHDAGELDDTSYVRHAEAIISEGNEMARSKRLTRIVAWAVAAAIVGGIIWVIAWSMHKDSANGDSTYQQARAIQACRDGVRDKLKSPRSARFSSESANGQGLAWEVTGLVDSDNSFGASVRSGFSCQVSDGVVQSVSVA